MTISRRQTSLFTREELTSSQEVFPANPSQWQANEKELRMNAISGNRCLEQYKRLNQSTSWGRTYSALLIGTREWYSNRSALIWRMRATKSSRLYFQLVPKMPLTEEIEFGLLPTPTKSDGKGGTTKNCNFSQRKLQYQTLTQGTDVEGSIYPSIDFYEAMMGFPTGWTELKRSATPSSQK